MSGKGKDNMTEEQKQALKKSLQSFINQLSLQEAEPEPEKPAFKFWKTQPVPAIGKFNFLLKKKKKKTKKK